MKAKTIPWGIILIGIILLYIGLAYFTNNEGLQKKNEPITPKVSQIVIQESDRCISIEGEGELQTSKAIGACLCLGGIGIVGVALFLERKEMNKHESRSEEKPKIKQ